MTIGEKVYAEQRKAVTKVTAEENVTAKGGDPMKDRYGREIDYMRISITDRCNLHCNYCRPKETEGLPMQDILTKEEILRVCKAAVSLGITKFKITGGEPLLREDCTELIGAIKRMTGVRQVTLTTNGMYIARWADALQTAGVDCVNVSLDTLDRKLYEKITGTDGLELVLQGINALLKRQIPVHINTVLQKELNDTVWKELLQLTKTQPLAVRFIELMPVGEGKSHTGVSNQNVKGWIEAQYGALKPLYTVQGNGPAVYYGIRGHKGTVGFISPIHGRFCDQCNRIRMTADGKCKPCLCYGEALDGKTAIAGGDPEQIRSFLQKAIEEKPQMHCFEKREKITEEKQMVQIGG